MAISEFSLIERYFEPLGRLAGTHADDIHRADNSHTKKPTPGVVRGVVLGIGDDCALLETPPGQQLAVSIDTLVEGVHFLPNSTAEVIASRALGACLSDLAAMGAEPAWFTLAITLPESNEAWLKAFSESLAQCAQPHRLILVGGDTTRGKHLSVSIQVHGWVPIGQALRRDKASAGDHVFVTGTLGDSAAGLNQLQNNGHNDYLIERFCQPIARIDTGIMLRGYASAAIDISDGLLADLGHILERSQLGAIIDPQSLPLSAQLLSTYDFQTANRWALSGGEDFELCFCIPDDRLADFLIAIKDHSVPITRIGQLRSEPGLFLQQQDGSLNPCEAKGYKHF